MTASAAASVLHLELHQFFVAVERRHDPRLAGRPVVVGGGRASAGRVVTASREAVADGVRPGMCLREAARRSPEATFLDGDVERYLEASSDIDARLRRGMPGLTWRSIDEATADLGRLAPGQARRLAELAHAELEGAWALEASIGIARSPVAAAVACALARPDGLVFVLPGYDARFLASQPLDLLPDVPEMLMRRLHTGGLRTIGDLAALDAASLRILGAEAVTALPLPAADSRPARPADGTPPTRLTQTCAFPRATADASLLRAMGTAAVRRLARDLTGLGLVAGTVRVRGVQDGTASTSASVRLDRATASQELLGLVTRLLIGKVLKRLGSMTQVAVTVTRLEPVAQLSLLEEQGCQPQSRVPSRPELRALVAEPWLGPRTPPRRQAS